MKTGAPAFGAQLKALREAAGLTQEKLATIAGLSVHGVSALERGHRRRPQIDTIRALSAALDLTGATRDALFASARAASPTTSSVESRVIALPTPLTVLRGRDHDLETLRRWIADPLARLITLTGPGGVGKTRLAIELARTIADAGSTHVAFAPLAPIRDAALAAGAIAEAIGLADISASDLAKRARAACERRPTLLVLDNFEQVLDAAPVVADLLASTVSLRVVVTSRAPLRIRGEREYALQPLALDADAPAPTAIADARRSPALQLFVERVKDVQPDFRITSGNGRAVAAICRRLDALPLALELAAPWLKVLTVEDLLARLERDVLFSAVASRDAPERQQAMNATVAWSYQLLTTDEKRLFRRLGVLPGRFPLEAARAVSGGRRGLTGSDEVLRVMAGLIDKSLLPRAESSASARPLYRMLETVRAYAAHELTAAGERDDALGGLANYCAAEVSLAREGLVGPAQVEYLDRVRADLESYRAALTWLIERGRADEAADIASGLLFFWMIRGHAAEGLGWLEQILKLPELPPAAESKALLGAAAMLYTRGEMGRVRIELARVLRLAGDVGDVNTVAQAEDLLGHAEHAVGNLDGARDRLTRGVELFRKLGIPWGIGDALSGLAQVALATGDMTQAERLLDEASSTLRQAGPWFRLLPLYVRAILAVRLGRPNQALTSMRECLTCIRELDDKFAFVYALVPLAAAAALKGQAAWVAQILGARDAVTEATGATVVDHSVHDLCEQAEKEARARLGPDRWTRAYVAGRRVSIDALLSGINVHTEQPSVRQRRARRTTPRRH